MGTTALRVTRRIPTKKTLSIQALPWIIESLSSFDTHNSCFPDVYPCSHNRSRIVATDKGYMRLRPRNETLLRDVIAWAGPVSAAMYGSLETFYFYADGIYDDSSCPIGTTHSILICERQCVWWQSNLMTFQFRWIRNRKRNRKWNSLLASTLHDVDANWLRKWKLEVTSNRFIEKTLTLKCLRALLTLCF
jgi:hypothetical protein